MYVEQRRDESRHRRTTHRAVTARSTERFPWQVGAAALLWVSYGLTLIGSGTGTTSPSADPEQVEQITGQLGSDTVASTVEQGPGVTWVIVGVAVCILGGLLALGQGWTRYVLMGIGASSIVALALSGAWESLVAMGVLGVASILLLAPRAHRYLS